MPIAVAQNESHRSIRLEGWITIECSGELKSLLVDWAATGKNLEVDLEGAEQIDLSILQLLWAAEREAAERGLGIISRPSQAATAAARDVGFDRIPGAGAPGE